MTLLWNGNQQTQHFGIQTGVTRGRKCQMNLLCVFIYIWNLNLHRGILRSSYNLDLHEYGNSLATSAKAMLSAGILQSTATSYIYNPCSRAGTGIASCCMASWHCLCRVFQNILQHEASDWKCRNPAWEAGRNPELSSLKVSQLSLILQD